MGVHGCSDQSPVIPAACVLVLGVHLSGLWCQNPTVFGVVSFTCCGTRVFSRNCCFLSLRYSFRYSNE